MQQIAEWLKKLGMSEYAARFTENGIDVSVLPHLTDQDLKDLGVLLGHRRKILAATAELGIEPRSATCTCTCTCTCTSSCSAGAGLGRRCATADRRCHGRAGRRRTPASDRDVLRSGGLDHDFRAARLPRSGASWSAPILTPLRRL